MYLFPPADFSCDALKILLWGRGCRIVNTAALPGFPIIFSYSKKHILCKLHSTKGYFMEKLGEKAFKKVTVGGKLVDKRLCCSRISEYDLNGNIVHAKSSDGYEE